MADNREHIPRADGDDIWVRLTDNGDGTYSVSVSAAQLAAILDSTGAPDDARTTDADATDATVISLLKGILNQLQNGTISVDLL